MIAAAVKASTAEKDRWQQRLVRSGYLVGAILFHIILFVLVATWIVFRPPAADQSATFLPTSVRPPLPPAPPPPSGGEAANDFEPSVDVSPPQAVASIITSPTMSSFSVKSVKVSIPNVPSSSTPPSGTGLSGQNAPGDQTGAGSPFGSSDDSGTAELQGYLYDLKQTRDQTPTGMDPNGYHGKIRDFVAANWDPEVLRPYYKARKPLSTSSIFIPIINAADGPKAFGVENEVQPDMYCIWYKVTAAPPVEGTYHFVGIGDDILVVRVNGTTVLDGCNIPVTDELRSKQKTINMVDFDPTYPPNGDFQIGTPFHLGAGEQADIDVLIGEEPGGKSDYFLFIQRDEDTYQSQSNGSPLLPIFRLNSTPIHPKGEPRSFPPYATTSDPWQPGTK